ncbi:hypothetical protein CUMW_104480, partial [Citrus unshiu]
MREDTKVSNYSKFDSQLLTTFISSLYITGILASLIASSVTRALGRKVSILIGGVAFLAGSALGVCAFNIYMLIFGRLLLGVGIGFGNQLVLINMLQSVPLYLSEMTTPKYRGTFNIGFQLCAAIGLLSANLLNCTQKIKGGWGWRISLAMAAAPASILTIGASTVLAIISMILADKFGRKVLFLVGGIQMLVSQVMIGSTMAAQLGDWISEGYAYLILVLVCLYSSDYCYSWGPLVGNFFFFGGLVLIMTTLVHFFLPETKNVPIEQMDKVWREHWFWMKIVEDAGEENKKIQEAPFEDRTAVDMAVGLAITSEGGQYYNGKVTPFVVLSCIVAATGGLIFGYDIGISGGVTSMEPFLKKFFPGVYLKMREDTKVSNYCKFDSQLLTTFTSSLYIAGLIASLFASSVTRAFGRKASILVGGTAFLAGSALGGAAFNIYMLIFGRSVPLYLSEMAPPKHRGAFNIGFQVCIAIGVLSANLLNYGTQKIKGDWGWRISLAMAAAPASILTLGALFMPETPNSIIQRSNDHQEAKTMLQRVRGTADVEAELNDLIRASSISKTINHPFNKIIQRKYRPQLILVSQVIIGSIMAAELVLICVYKAGFGFSWGPLGWLVPSEIFPLEIRSAGQSITVAVLVLIYGFTFFSFCSNIFSQGLSCHFKAGVFFFFGGWLTVMTTFVHFFLPETKNVPIELMDEVWREHWFWRKFFDDVGEESKIQGAIHLKYFQRKSEATVTPTALLEAVICQFQPALPQTSQFPPIIIHSFSHDAFSKRINNGFSRTLKINTYLNSVQREHWFCGVVDDLRQTSEKNVTISLIMLEKTKWRIQKDSALEKLVILLDFESSITKYL